ncbi:MAG TPA: alkaline phosphatase PhoX [Gemmatimonadales bacterium]|nr:alkaline phosphatase PhoX [Gemmatimonadales bacterium]
MKHPNRRSFLQQSISGAVLLAPSLQGLMACARATTAGDAGLRPAVAGSGEGGYGPLRSAGPELALPAGFSYTVLTRTGKPMTDGTPTPGAFDGMAAFALPNGNVRLICNHENRDTARTARPKGDVSKAYDARAGGCTTSLEVRIAEGGAPEVVRDFISLNGTIVNCAGGPTPWQSWLTCEESVEGKSRGWEQEHGYIFEVPAAAESEVTPVPLKAMGRFIHEAVAVDPETGIVYETEDRLVAGFYRFIPSSRGVLAEGGRLEMLAIDDRPNYDTADGQQVGDTFGVHWVPIENPDPRGASGDSAAVFAQGFTRGAARFARLEGCWWGDDSVYFHSTNGGDAKLGQVWQYRPTGADRGELTLVFESPSADVLDYPDNVTVSPRGGIVICEDGGGEQFIRGLTPDGRIFPFARNTLNNTEFAGACFSPDGRTLFLNIMGSTTDAGTQQGATIAIQGPWENGAL